ncbi:hypothetical protein BRAO375_3660014 [Bradyrhizobium sp. ORS 375]|nr:hypothetical protein BRAO375_3660014 [Bradyrhizobium sp. ORS 375]
MTTGAGTEGREGGLNLQTATAWWPTPAMRDYRTPNSEDHLDNSSGALHLDQLPNFVTHLWRTPTALNENALGTGVSVENALKRVQRGNTINLQDQVVLWTPPANDNSRNVWMTPRANEVGEYQNSHGDKTRPYPTLTGQVLSHPDLTTLPSGDESSKPRRFLNPLFVEWLMGWPPLWSLASTGFACSETALSHWKQHMRSELSRLGSPSAPAVQHTLFG